MGFRVFALTIALVGAFPAAALAGGFEFPGAGTRPLGRAGAFHARADSPLAVLYNPANLASLSGPQLMLDTSLAFLDACYTRTSSPSNTYGDASSVGDTAGNGTIFAGNGFQNAEYPTTCNGGPPNPLPQLLFATRVNSWLGVGGGLLVPNAVGITEFGNTDSVTASSGGVDVPVPGRYQLVSQQILFLNPSIGVGVAPNNMFRFGATLHWGLALVDFLSHTSTLGGEDPVNDVRTRLKAQDLFVPGFVLSAHMVPHDNWDVMVGFRWQDAVDADAELEFETGTYGVGDEASGNPGAVPQKTKLDDVGFKAGIPWDITFGIRYADRISPRPEDPQAVSKLSGRVEDPMANERWDIEFNFRYENSSSLERFQVDVPNETIDVTTVRPNGATVVSPFGLPSQTRVEHQWLNQYTFRLGGDYNVLPGMAAVRGGLSFETNGVNTKYAQLDFWPTRRLGLHVGATLRLGDFDVSLAYAHFFQATVTASNSNASLSQVNARELPVPMNAGVYESNVDILSLGLAWNI